MPKFTDDIDALAGLSEAEDWDYKQGAAPHVHPILRNYVTYTYRRVAEEKKISITPDEENCCWNSGLITSTQEPVYPLNRSARRAPCSNWKSFRGTSGLGM
jgi:hypothetical protein